MTQDLEFKKILQQTFFDTRYLQRFFVKCLVFTPPSNKSAMVCFREISYITLCRYGSGGPSYDPAGQEHWCINIYDSLEHQYISYSWQSCDEYYYRIQKKNSQDSLRHAYPIFHLHFIPRKIGASGGFFLFCDSWSFS